MRKPDSCDAQETGGGQVICARCGLNWDHDDPDPPKCPRQRQDSPDKPLPRRRAPSDHHPIGGSL